MDHPAPITRVIPCPRPIRLGGAVYLASELRLADVAELQSWIEAETLDPFEDDAPTILSGRRDREWKQLLWRALDGVEDYPPRVGSAAADDLLGSADGLARQLWLSLRRERPDITLDATRALMAEVNNDEWSRFSRLAWGRLPKAIVFSLVCPEPGSGKTSDWSALWCSYVAKAGPKAPEFGDLTLTQLNTWLADGDPVEASLSSGDSTGGNQAIMERAQRIADFWGDVAADPEPQPAEVQP